MDNEPSDLYEEDLTGFCGACRSRLDPDGQCPADVTEDDPTPELMPLELLASHTLIDVSETAEDQTSDYELSTYVGRAGGELDKDSGVLTLSYKPEDDQGYQQQQIYTETVVRFVEVEKLLDALSLLGYVGVGRNEAPGLAREYWRDVLAEKLDAHGL